jgi:hypothetical protein
MLASHSSGKLIPSSIWHPPAVVKICKGTASFIQTARTPTSVPTCHSSLFGFWVSRLQIEALQWDGRIRGLPLCSLHSGAQSWVKVTCQMLVETRGLSLWSHASAGQDTLRSCAPLAGIQLCNSTDNTLGHYATSRKIAGLIPDEVVFFN